jgi:restriction system protein
VTRLAAFDGHLPQDVATDSRTVPENPEDESGAGRDTRMARQTKKDRPMARRQGFFDDLMSIGLKLPWKVGVAAAVMIFVALHVVAICTQTSVSANNLANMGAVVQHGFIHVFAEFFQYIIPAGLLIGTTVGYFKQRHSGALFVAARENPKPAITSMSWRDFERLVGEVFRRQGFTVSGFGGHAPDGGVDLGLTKNGQRYLAQCKHWRKRQVGVTVVRELNGVISAQGAHGGFVVTGGEFTREAREFADSCDIKLIDGLALEELIGVISRQSWAADSGVAVVTETKPACPRCGTAMIQRTAKKGQFAGQRFWGCGRYPKCRGILKISLPR